MTSRSVYRCPRFNTSFSTGRHSYNPRGSIPSAPCARTRSPNIWAQTKLTSVALQSSLNPTVFILVVASCLLGAGFSFFGQTSRGNLATDLTTSWQAETKNNSMGGQALPGRPGNLTKEQEVKLQELWAATLKLFGVGPQPANGVEKEDEQHSQAGEFAEKKKKRGLFGRKNKGEDSDGKQSDKLTDTEDKYGQTKEFYQVLATQKPEDIRRAFWSMVKHDNPDALLLRFLRARKWDVQNALVMLISTMHWRLHEMNIDDDVMKNGESAALADSLNSSEPTVKKEGIDFLTQLRMGKCYFHGTDKEDRPMCIVRVRLHRQGEQSEASLERFTVYTLETARLMLVSHVDTAAIVFDMTGFSLANMDYGPVKFMIKCFEANYPESLGVVLIHRSPWIFHGIWNIIKGWLDPVVASKIHFTKTLDELAAFIPAQHIPNELGGPDPFTYNYIEPVEGENDRMEDFTTRDRLLQERAALVTEYEDATKEWIVGSDSEAGGKRRADSAEKLRIGYWALDPHIRARSIYDRTGLIREGGKVCFYDDPKFSTTTKDVVANGPIPAGHAPGELD